jgi:hypothetical protein
MISKDQLADAMMRECDICQHLYEKLAALGPEALEYRPSPAQRTTLELLRYLTVCGIAGLRFMAERRWAVFGEFQDRTCGMGAADFPAAMTRQKSEIHDFFEALTEEQLESQEALLPSGGTAPLDVAILGGPLKWLAAYKLQLFLYAKAAGASGLGTANAWAGRDAQPP